LDQNTVSYSDWQAKFMEAVRKRATHGTGTPLVCLSSGYDSGAIALALNLLQLPYKTISIMSGENEAVIRRRMEINSRYCVENIVLDGFSKADQRGFRDSLKDSVEPLKYSASGGITLHEDGGAIGMYGIALEAKRRGIKFCISGAGADELISDYGHLGHQYTPNSNFGGNFPKNLAEVFPWRNFYGGTQRDYLFKEELILGYHGIEGRYPFLDFNCVQAFLNLSTDLKNVEYKAPIADFLRTYNYPFEEGKKRGFSPGKSGGLKRMKSLLPRTLDFLRGANL